jgi:hypothetical protein
MSKKRIDSLLDREDKRLFRRLQTAKALKGLEKAFSASPAEMGRAALRARKQKQRSM